MNHGDDFGAVDESFDIICQSIVVLWLLFWVKWQILHVTSMWVCEFKIDLYSNQSTHTK